MKGAWKVLFNELKTIVERKALDLENTKSNPDLAQLELILDVAIQQVKGGKLEAKVGALKWIILLFRNVYSHMARHVDKIFPILLNTLSDGNEEVVIHDLMILASICQASESPYLRPLMKRLYDLFHSNQHLLETKGPDIIRVLSVHLNPEYIYLSFVQMIQNEENLDFARRFVGCLNFTLFTTKALIGLRNSIKDLSTPVRNRFFLPLKLNRVTIFFCRNNVSFL